MESKAPMALAVSAPLRSSAISHESFFSNLLDRIPAHLVLPPPDIDPESSGGPLKGPERFYKHRKVGLHYQSRKKQNNRQQ